MYMHMLIYRYMYILGVLFVDVLIIRASYLGSTLGPLITGNSCTHIEIYTYACICVYMCYMCTDMDLVFMHVCILLLARGCAHESMKGITR